MTKETGDAERLEKLEKKIQELEELFIRVTKIVGGLTSQLTSVEEQLEAGFRNLEESAELVDQAVKSVEEGRNAKTDQG